MGVDFAIPINLAKAIAGQFINKSEVTRGYLGIVIRALTPQLAESFGLKQSVGILIADVAKDSPVAKAGLRKGDVLIGYRNDSVSDIGDFRNRVSLTTPGKDEPLTIVREVECKEMTIAIGKLTEDKLAAFQDPADTSNELCMTVRTLNPELAE